jgi:hypothetical protein
VNLLDENIPLDQRDLLGLQFWQRNRAARQRAVWPGSG